MGSVSKFWCWRRFVCRCPFPGDMIHTFSVSIGDLKRRRPKRPLGHQADAPRGSAREKERKEGRKEGKTETQSTKRSVAWSEDNVIAFNLPDGFFWNDQSAFYNETERDLAERNNRDVCGCQKKKKKKPPPFPPICMIRDP